MNVQTRRNIIGTLRSAARTLRASPKVTATAESALAAFVIDGAALLKQNEEQNPDIFMDKVRPKEADLLKFAVIKQMLQEGPRGSGVTSLDPTLATQTFEKLLKVMSETGLNQTDLLAPFISALVPKNWGDVNVDEDLVLFRYETPGPVTIDLDSQALTQLVEDARKESGAIDRAASLVKEENILWDPTDVKTGTINCAITVNNIEAKWCGCVPTTAVLDSIVSQLSVIEVDSANQQQGWWDAARSAPSLPQQVLPIVRGKDQKVLFLRVDADQVEEWASGLAGWSDGNEESPTPLIVRDAVSNDILS